MLAAEDDENQAELLQLIWTEARICNKLHIVRDGQDVVDYLSGAGDYADRQLFPIPAMLLMDLHMEKMGAMEVLEWLYPRPEPAFPCIVLTASRSLTYVVQASRRRAHSFLFKPLGTSEFKSFITKYKGIEVEAHDTGGKSIWSDSEGGTALKFQADLAPHAREWTSRGKAN